MLLPHTSFQTILWVNRDLGEAGGLYLGGCSAPVNDVSHLFWRMKPRDATAATGVFSIFFILPPIFGEAHKPMNRIIMHEPLTR